MSMPKSPTTNTYVQCLNPYSQRLNYIPYRMKGQEQGHEHGHENNGHLSRVSVMSSRSQFTFGVVEGMEGREGKEGMEVVFGDVGEVGEVRECIGLGQSQGKEKVVQIEEGNGLIEQPSEMKVSGKFQQSQPVIKRLQTQQQLHTLQALQLLQLQNKKQQQSVCQTTQQNQQTKNIINYEQQWRQCWREGQADQLFVDDNMQVVVNGVKVQTGAEVGNNDDYDQNKNDSISSEEAKQMIQANYEGTTIRKKTKTNPCKTQNLTKPMLRIGKIEYKGKKLQSAAKKLQRKLQYPDKQPEINIRSPKMSSSKISTTSKLSHSSSQPRMTKPTTANVYVNVHALQENKSAKLLLRFKKSPKATP